MNVFIVDLGLGTSMTFSGSPQIWHFSGNARDERNLEKLEIWRGKCNCILRKYKTTEGKNNPKPNFRGKKGEKRVLMICKGKMN